MAKLGPSRGSVLFVDASRRKQSQKSIGGGARRSRMSGPVKSNSYLDQLTRTSRGPTQPGGESRERHFGAAAGGTPASKGEICFLKMGSSAAGLGGKVPHAQCVPRARGHPCSFFGISGASSPEFRHQPVQHARTRAASCLGGGNKKAKSGVLGAIPQG